MVKPNDLKAARTAFVEDLKNKNRSTSTILAYNKDVDQLIQFVAPKKVHQPNNLTTSHIEDFKKYLADKKYTAKSISRKLNSIKTFCRFLLAQKAITTNPAAAVSHPKYDIKPPRVLTKMEYRALRDVCRDDIRIRAIVELLLQTGIRIGELANIRMEDTKKNELHIRPAESNPERIIPPTIPKNKEINGVYLSLMYPFIIWVSPMTNPMATASSMYCIIIC